MCLTLLWTIVVEPFTLKQKYFIKKQMVPGLLFF